MNTPTPSRLRPALLALPLWLLACGGGNDTTTPTEPLPPTPVACAPFADSFGRSLSCDDMRQLPGAIWGFVEPGSDAATGAGDAGADGTVAQDALAGGGPLANAVVEFKDQRSRVVRATTDANGYYRISLRGLTPPLTATVLSWPAWKSVMVTPLVRAPAHRKFYTVNLTSLTHALASDMARSAGLAGVDALQPPHVAAQAQAVPALVAALNDPLTQPLALAGLRRPFDPLTSPFAADGLSRYDRVLRSISFTRLAAGDIAVSSLSAAGAMFAGGCEVPSFTGVPAQGGGYATMNMRSDGGLCTLFLSGDPEGKVPAQGGKLLTQPSLGSVVFGPGNRMAYTPLYGSSGTDVFSYEMSATLSGETIPLVVQVTVNVSPPAPR